MDEQTNTDNWLAKEEATFKAHTDKTFEQLPSLKLVPNVITEFDVDFSQPFNKWTDEENNTMKAIIPITCNGTKMNWWVNIKNPVYAEVIRAGRTGQVHFKILQTGTQKNTRYALVK